jgi:hypothetical protein
MSKEDWFAHYEEVLAEHPELSDEQASDLAAERQIDAYAALADRLNDETKHRLPEEKE